MALPPGTRLGPYDIVAPLGAGGMGEVYQARDTRLDRTVAIKILPPHLSEDATLRQRFEREAKTISRLNHPHICVLYDVGVQDGTHYLVMECVEGETLAKRLEKGAMPLEQVLKYGTEIADALDKAHRSGVVHRDLKPGNIMLTPTGAKLLDFGLAKPAAPMTNLATLTATKQESPVTEQGTIVGTFQYMSPEQVEGKEVDARSDIFSLGSVLYEMATGQKAFQGKSQLSVASAILEKEPAPISSIKPLTPPGLDHAIRRCLAKEPEKRWQSAADLAGELQWIAEGGSQAGVPALTISQRKLRDRLLWAAVAVFAISTIALASFFVLRAPKPVQPMRFSVLPPENSYINAGAGAAVSPDGRQLAFVASDSTGKDVLWVRSLDSLTPRLLAATGGAERPFWSPDSRWIGFFANNTTLRKIDITGGGPISVVGVMAGNGGTWNRNGVIVFGAGATRLLYRVSATGGEVVPLTKREEAVAGARHAVHFLPDGNHYLYDAPQTGTIRSVYVASLDSDAGKLLAQAATSPVYQQGYLLYLHGTTLIAQPFDEKRLETVGDASTLAEGVQSFSASQTGGVLAYWTNAVEDNPQLTWFDRKGKPIGTLGEPIEQVHIRISPDGTKVAAEIIDPQVSLNSDIWLYDVLRGVKTRLTSGPGSARSPCWSPDGRRIIFSSDRRGHFDLYEKAIDGSGTEELVFESQTGKVCESWSSDGKFLLFMTIPGDSDARRELWTLPLSGDRKPVPYLQSGYDQRFGQFSPDGKWIAYTSNESGRNEVYVRPFPASGGKLLVSPSGGSHAVWRRDGKEIFYIDPSGKMMAAKLRRDGSALAIDVVVPLFQANAEPFLHSYDASGDGQRFLIAKVTPQKLPSPITVVVNWLAGTKNK